MDWHSSRIWQTVRGVVATLTGRSIPTPSTTTLNPDGPDPDESVRQWCWRQWIALPPGQRNRIVRHLQQADSFTVVKDKIAEAMAEDPESWAVEYHFGWGMAVRNLLRDVYADVELPTGNWDDYYIPAVEAAVRGENYVT